MSLAWGAALAAVIHHPLFALGLTLGAYQLALKLFETSRLVLLQPVLVSMLVVVGVLTLCQLDLAEYQRNTQVLGTLLGPATVALAVPLYLNLRRIRQLLWPTLATLVLGGAFATLSGLVLGWLLGADHLLLMTLAPKSVTSPIAMLVAEQVGGVAGMAAVFVLITGVIGAIVGPGLLSLLNVRAPEARGLALGISAHAVGTSVALAEGETCGAFAALGMSLMGVGTAIVLPLAISLFV
ncbi:LrgB family protein [Pseudomonas typographi]|uniref:LrgB family protein n=1 Tax=Pseudomonas typographi TaxID=2715964 RepID=A0ABR7Z6G0_9PSED|nr:LrgB family protein [Pseudomonas typographi]MBD1553459.1 LrgB family protein [Pseudomonas typographi]MBD1600933.1 LrgB family protein [Pseudomonas typographi]